MGKQERAERTRQAIVEAAAAVFESDGYSAAQLDGIIRRAMVTKGALYFHFDSKRGLACAVVEEARATLDGVIGRALARRDAEEPLQVLIDLTHGVGRRLAADPILRAGLRLGGDPDLFEDRRSGLRIDWAVLVGALLADDREAARGGGPPAARCAPLCLVLEGLEYLLRQRCSAGSEVIGPVWELILPGLTAPAPPAGYDPAGRAPDPTGP